MRALLLAVVIAALWMGGAGRAAVVSIQPEADVGPAVLVRLELRLGVALLPGRRRPRLPIGGVDDKVWRAALRFPLGSVPPGASISSAEVSIYHDGTCVAPRLAAVPCAVGYVVDAHRDPLAELDARARGRRRRACRGDRRRPRGRNAAVAHLGRHGPRPCLASRDVAEQRAAPEAAGRRRGVRLERAVRAVCELTARRAAAPARRRLHGAGPLARCRCRRSPGRVRSPTRSRFSSS